MKGVYFVVNNNGGWRVNGILGEKTYRECSKLDAITSYKTECENFMNGVMKSENHSAKR